MTFRSVFDYKTAHNKKTNSHLGISVKTRTREGNSNFDSIKFERKDIDAINESCSSFLCTPYLCLFSDKNSTIKGFLVPLEEVLKCNNFNKTLNVKINDDHIEYYSKSPNCMIINLGYSTINNFESSTLEITT